MAHSQWAEISQIKLSQKTKSGLYVMLLLDNKSIGSNAQQQWVLTFCGKVPKLALWRHRKNWFLSQPIALSDNLKEPQNERDKIISSKY